MAETLTAAAWLEQLRRQSRVLLINPYVQDVRYPWVRWNQPADLLKLARLLKDDYECEVELIDCMLPNESGRVPDRFLEDLNTGEKYRTFGTVLDKAQRNLLFDLNRQWSPDYVVLSTLTSYWGPRVIPAIRAALRSAMPQVKVVLTGPFAIYETTRAQRTMVDTLVTTMFPIGDKLPMWELYQSARTLPFHEGRKCRFAGLTFHSMGDGQYVREQVRLAKQQGINSFVFFVDDLFVEQGQLLTEALQCLSKEGRLDLHGLCGITPSKAPDGIWQMMLQAGYRSVHLEYDRDGDELRLDAYHRAMGVLGQRLHPGEVSGFVMVGCPYDDLSRLVKHTLDILSLTGSVIPKPYTPSPVEDRAFYDEIVKHVGRLDKMGPRAFPLVKHQQQPLSAEDFEEFFGLTTELNKKLQGKAFDLFDDSAITDAFRSSLSKGVWKLVE